MPSTTNLLIIKVSTPSQPITAEQVREHLSKEVEGEQVAFEDEVIREMTDLARVKKIYKLNSAGGSGKKGVVVNGLGNEMGEIKEAEILVLGSMALRGATN
jgi:EKC/KEOPS complex subunit CGI121/TPRKB